MTENVSGVSIGLTLTTAELRRNAREAEAIMEGLYSDIEKAEAKHKSAVERATHLNETGFLSDGGYDKRKQRLDEELSRARNDSMIAGMSSASNGPDAMQAGLKAMKEEKEASAKLSKERLDDARSYANQELATMRQQADALKWQAMTEAEKNAARKQADIEHLNAMVRAGAMTDAEMKKQLPMAGRLGLGNIAGDNNMNNKGFQGAMMAQQLGFGIQDFASQVMNSKNMVDGLGRGIMAVSNNVQMLGAAFGPTGLAITAIGGAAAGIVLPAAIKWLSNTKDTEKELEVVRDQMKDIAKLAREVADSRFGSGIGDKVESLAKARQIARQTARELGGDSDNALIDKQRAEMRIEEMKKNGARTFGNPLTDTQEQVNKNRELARELENLESIKVKHAEIGKAAGEQNKIANDASKQIKRLNDAATIDDARMLQRELSKIMEDEADDARMIAQKKLEATRDSINQEIESYKIGYARLTKIDREAADVHIAEAERKKKANQDVLDAINPRADREIAGKRLQEEQDRKEKALNDADAMMKKMREDALEKHNNHGFVNPVNQAEDRADERAAMKARQEREMREFQRNIALQSDEERKRNTELMQAKQQGEQANLAVKQKQEEMQGLQPTNRGASGVDVNSSAGVAAINRAVSGTRGELDIQKEQLEQLKRIAKAQDDKIKVVALGA